MKKRNLILTVICVALLVIFSGCGGREGRGELVNYAEWIQGTWRNEQTRSYTRFENGNFSENSDGRYIIRDGRYVIEENIITLNFGHHTTRGRLYFSGRDKLRVSLINNNAELELTRQR